MRKTKVFEDFMRDFNFQKELGSGLNILKGGKGFRAQLIRLLSSIFEISHTESEILMDVTESLHTATLVHDDVIDKADMRRGELSFNNTLNNKKSILLGDYYLAKTIQKVTELNSIELVYKVSQVLSELVEGEWYQASLSAQDWNLDAYKKVANYKTGSIFTWCLESVLKVKFPNFNPEGPSIIGNAIGEIFQIVDDYLDFNQKDKTLLADWKNGNINYFLLKIDSEKLSSKNSSLEQAQLLKQEVDKVMVSTKKDISHLSSLAISEFDKLLQNCPDNMYSEKRSQMFREFTLELETRYNR